MFHIKVTCQKSFALTRMNSQRTATFFLNLPCCFFSALRDLSLEDLSLAHPRPPLSPATLSSTFLTIFYSFCVPSRLTSGFVPLIEHSCRTHRPSHFFPLHPLVFFI